MKRLTMKHLAAMAGAAAMVIAAAAAQAQSVGIGTTKGGALAQISAAIAKVVTRNSALSMRPQPMGGTQQYFPIVNAGELDFGLSNIPQYTMGVEGFGISKRPHKNLRLVASMMKFQVGVLTASSANIQSLDDIRGKTYPVGFKASPVIGLLMRCFLANAGIGQDEIKPVPAVALRQHWNAMKQGKIQVATAAIGSAIVKDLNASISGGVRFVSLDPSPEALARLNKLYPKSWIEPIPPNKKLVGFDKPLQALSYDYSIWTHAGLKDEVVYQVAKAMYANEAALKETSPLWRSHRSANMAKDHGPDLPYHPGAVKFYKEAGIWRR